mmetsp:Transcript_40062/g.120760  ORF Transcript_40062/g.120760 Transcript_40062/m.120760 type:complete len:223 (+) Transcript_40062:398-1066(+)
MLRHRPPLGPRSSGHVGRHPPPLVGIAPLRNRQGTDQFGIFGGVRIGDIAVRIAGRGRQPVRRHGDGSGAVESGDRRHSPRGGFGPRDPNDGGRGIRGVQRRATPRDAFVDGSVRIGGHAGDTAPPHQLGAARAPLPIDRHGVRRISIGHDRRVLFEPERHRGHGMEGDVLRLRRGRGGVGSRLVDGGEGRSRGYGGGGCRRRRHCRRCRGRRDEEEEGGGR